jgi:hypothetical protein
MSESANPGAVSKTEIISVEKMVSVSDVVKVFREISMLQLLRSEYGLYSFEQREKSTIKGEIKIRISLISCMIPIPCVPLKSK